MQEAVKLISESGIWVFLIGVLTSIIIGIVKTPIRAKYVDKLQQGEERTKRENIFDTVTYLSTYVVAFLAAMVYYTISTKLFNIAEIAKLSIPIWLSQSLIYGAWKKLGIKRVLKALAKLLLKDTNKDGEITLDEALNQIVRGIKEGKFGVEDLVTTVNTNLSEVVEDISKLAEGSEESEKIEELAAEGIDEVAENIKEEVTESAKEVANVVLGKLKDGTEVSIGSQQVIKF